jgi:hypothetical protein
MNVVFGLGCSLDDGHKIKEELANYHDMNRATRVLANNKT